jgi:hypothetical protein
MLSQLPEGEYEGSVMNYNSGTRELIVSSVMSRKPIKLILPANTPVARTGQAAVSLTPSATSDLVVGTLISVKFRLDKEGRGVVSQVAVLATPRSVFEFIGNLSELDMRSGILDLIDTSDETSYQISFDSVRFPISHKLHQGDLVRVTASLDGAR